MAVESCSEHEVATTREVGITSLPLELLGLILWSDQLTRDDVEAVRLSCHALAPAAASRLFYRISISNLVSDRDTFLAICNSPHLAQHVREVEWLEISHFFGEFDTRKENGVGSEMILEEDEGTQMADLCRYLETTSRHLFWLFSSPADLGLSGNAEHIAAVKASRGDAVARFCPVFESALDKLPSLHTFISRPMTSDRVIPDALYPIQASAFQSFKDTGSLKHLFSTHSSVA
ncbi:hypothetical protein QBC34DRAFT_300328 [Podospora aff. communis PSN243]|uniref:F-box domain-containing protein n=1 Tax=Podospora aff. communis PSN243 TaxID=3040156 RepID=A0AAV9GKN4_9PEZI|nr:hypothetical protein QBC34DRAFT_300328 [Podospora aff. communis PSN243]